VAFPIKSTTSPVSRSDETAQPYGKELLSTTVFAVTRIVFIVFIVLIPREKRREEDMQRAKDVASLARAKYFLA
jgi:uncharacterized membrane protein